jgi:transcriptional regulator with XRE-family HTH domain
MTSARRDQIVASLRDKEYRDLLVAEEIESGLPFQIRAMRQARGWSQRALADRTQMTQEGISRLENLDYGKYTLTTLKRLASTFDVALVVRFVPFSQLVDWVANLSPEDLAVPDYEHDSGLELADAPAGDTGTLLSFSKDVLGTGRGVRLRPTSTTMYISANSSLDYPMASETEQLGA